MKANPQNLPRYSFDYSKSFHLIVRTTTSLFDENLPAWWISPTIDQLVALVYFQIIGAEKMDGLEAYIELDLDNRHRKDFISISRKHDAIDGRTRNYSRGTVKYFDRAVTCKLNYDHFVAKSPENRRHLLFEVLLRALRRLIGNLRLDVNRHIELAKHPCSLDLNIFCTERAVSRDGRYEAQAAAHWRYLDIVLYLLVRDNEHDTQTCIPFYRSRIPYGLPVLGRVKGLVWKGEGIIRIQGRGDRCDVLININNSIFDFTEYFAEGTDRDGNLFLERDSLQPIFRKYEWTPPGTLKLNF